MTIQGADLGLAGVSVSRTRGKAMWYNDHPCKHALSQCHGRINRSLSMQCKWVLELFNVTVCPSAKKESNGRTKIK